MRLGIDVGGTNTDVVALDHGRVTLCRKVPTSADIEGGVRQALQTVFHRDRVSAADVDAVIIGTTQFLNAIVQRRGLARVGIIRAGAPTGTSLPPMTDWPEDLVQAIGGKAEMIRGGHRYDGRELGPLDRAELDRAIDRLAAAGIRNIVVSAVHSPVNPVHEEEMAAQVRRRLPECAVSPSHELGGLGLLERENAALLNAALADIAPRVLASFGTVLTELGVHCPYFLCANDGTTLNLQSVARHPVLTFASGPTNSMRGAAFLSGVSNAIVIDIGGTTTDVGVLRNGFPRLSNTVVEVGGVRVGFRMPDVLSIALGGGSLVQNAGHAIGPLSVGYRLIEEALVFGGSVLTATDVAVAAGAAGVGDRSRVAHLDASLIDSALSRIGVMLDSAIDRMRTSEQSVPLVLVGGGSILVRRPFASVGEVITPPNADVANAVGAAVAQVAGEAEQVFVSRILTEEGDAALEELTARASRAAARRGAAAATLRVVDVEHIHLSYTAPPMTRVRVKVVGDIDLAAGPLADSANRPRSTAT
ncbi:MAG TPA: hydantoinase/oxoprolinase family protein [Steroidobacteraceae bacterium]|jgi:N-methylhydantoinase A/oxoprolinase/acetone carboxylase beta subunit|nr:hydantoinase/oxoprolinase family protein [Steroidobacteraceae bacterium]